ncbi:hypothetical protein CYMTET_42167 [Cymbomonas tetramitiformis]|uniref:AAA+ ATPase domain-containing protein n=1 Tax=Cymbomonas tetramitiformis TaxID=36881 RepID=A0AAE0F1S9_9CHLO|nr:hypothetical protein CYMTET_42167 [Cymbomonas tetramitiformis]
MHLWGLRGFDQGTGVSDRFHSAAQSFGGTALLELHLSQLKDLSEPPADDVKLEEWLQERHDEHFQCGEEGQWEPKGEGRWEPKAAFSVVLADLVAARPPRLTPQLLEMVCLGGEDFIGLTNLMALGSHSAADVDARHTGLVNLTMWAQEVVLQTLEQSETSPDAPDPSDDGYGLQVLAEELERVIREGTAMLASSAERLTAAVAEAVSEQVRVVLVSGARDAAVRGKPKAVAALAACNSVLDGVEESLRGVDAAAAACLPLLQLTSKLLRALSMPFPDAIVESVIDRALHELDQAECSVETRLQKRLADALSAESFVNELRVAFLGLIKRPASEDAHGVARRELMQLAIKLDAEVARVAQNEVERCMENEERCADEDVAVSECAAACEHLLRAHVRPPLGKAHARVSGEARGRSSGILRQIAGTEPAASWTEEGREAWEEGVMPTTASKGLNLRALAQAQAAVVAKDSLVAGGKGLMETVKDRVREMTVKTQEQLAEWVDRCTGDLGDVATSALGDTCGALLAPALGLLGEVVKGRTNKLTTHTWQVREVAMLGALRALDALRHAAAALHDDAAAAGGSARADVQADVRAVRKELQAAVLVRLSLERTPSVQALQRQGEALAAELNVPLRAVCDLGAQGGDGDALLANQLKDVGGTLEELRKAMEGERESRAKREREEERERLAAIERHEAWAQAEHVVRKTIDAQLLELEEAQKAVALEPDLLQKQLLLVRCRGIHAALAQSSRNVNDIGTGIGVVVGFLTTVNDKLDVVNGSLNALQSSVRELGADLRRMVGQPVLEALAEQRSKRLAQCQELRREVYIATDGVGPGDDGKFLVSESNEPKDLLKAVKTELLESKEVSLLLLSGPAGSGKSTFVRHLEVYLEMEYVEQTRGERGELVLVKVSLPTLKNPMADLFREALARGYGLREAQIHELRDLARAGTVRLIFLLDAYDELPSQCLFKNLYMSNNLEQYRAHVEGDTPPAYPKVIITTRTELLSRAAEYRHAFVPMEMDKPARATVEKADASFLELRITPFGSKVDAYIHAKVALDVRRELERQVGALAPLSKDAAEALRAGAGALWRHDALKEGFGGDLLDAACAAVTAPGGRSESLERVTRYMRQVPHDLRLLPSWPVVWVLAGARAETPLGLEQTLKGFCEGLARAETGKIWLHRDYRDAFDAIPELKELTTTPFMVEIVMEILPKLEETRSTDASIKAKLMLLLEDDAVQMVWGCISRWCGLSDSVLLQVQAALEGGSDQAPGQGLENLKKLEEEVVQMLKGQDILLNQPKLVELGWEQLRATGLVSGPMRRRGVGSDGSTAAPDASMDALAGPAAEADWILDEAVEEVIQEEEGRLLEGTICKVGILYLLKSALCRRKVRASRIYAMFARMYVQREARKAVTQGAYDADTVEREGAQYAQRLALTMVAENVTKVPLRSDSELFHEESIWDPFLQDGGELRETVQKAAPVRCEGGMLTFIHKTELMARYGDAPQPVGAATQGGVKGSKEAEHEKREEADKATLLTAAAEGDMVEMLRELVDKGAEVDAEDGKGRTALTVALAFGQEAAARALLEAGAGVNAGTGQRPLHATAKKGMVEMVRELVDKGAEVDAEDGEVRTALTVALAFGQEAAARALLEAGAGVNAGTGQRPLHAVAKKGMEEMVRELAGKGAEVDAEDGEGRTALTVAVAFGQEAAARALLARSKLQPSVRLISTAPFTVIPNHPASGGAPSAEPEKNAAKNAAPLGAGHARHTERPVDPIAAQSPAKDRERSNAQLVNAERPVDPIATQSPAKDRERSNAQLVNTENRVDGQGGVKKAESADNAAAAKGGVPTEQRQPIDATNSTNGQQGLEKEAAGKVVSAKAQGQEALRVLMGEVCAGTLPHTLSLGQPEEAAQTLARLHAALGHREILTEVVMLPLLDGLFTATRHCAGNAALLGRLACLLRCVHRLLLMTMQLDVGGDLKKKRAQWKAEADKLRRLCVSRFNSAAQICGGTALLELHLSQMQLTQIHAHELSSEVVSAVANVTVGAVKAVLVGSYGTLVKGLGQAVSAGVDAVNQQLSQTCFAQLKALSEPPVDDVELERWLRELHDVHFKYGEEGQWEPKGEGRWEPKAAFSVVLADLVAARPPRLTPQLLETVCLGGEDFIGLSNLMAFGSHSSADMDARHAGLVNLTMWAQEVVLHAVEESETNQDAPDQAADTEQWSSTDDSWRDGYGLQVLAEELERVIQESTAKLASAADQLTAAVVEGVSKQVQDVLVPGARDAAVRGKPKAVAALAACNSVLDGVEESLWGVHGAAVACQLLLQLTSKLLRAFTMPLPDALAGGLIGRALHELDPEVCSDVETRLQKRLTAALRAESFVRELSDVLAVTQTSGCASTSSTLQLGARPAAPSDEVTEPSPRDAVKDSLTWLLSEDVLAEVRPLLGTLQAFLGLIKGPASKDSHEDARRELMKLAIELDDKVVLMAREEVERCMENEGRCAQEGVAAPGQHEAESLVGRLLEGFPKAVSEWLVPALGIIRQKLLQSVPSEGENSKTSSLPSGLIDAIAYVDAGMATLEQVSECSVACKDLLRTHVRPPLSKARAYLSGEARGNTGGWVPSFFTSRTKRPQASNSRAQEEEPAQVWHDLQLALSGLDWILHKITGTELTASQAEKGRNAWQDSMRLLTNAAECGWTSLMAPQSSEEEVPPQHAAHESASRRMLQVTAAFLQLSLHLKRARALAGSLQGASRRLNLRALAQAQPQNVAKDSLVKAKEALLETVKDRVREMTVEAQKQLADWADRCTGDFADDVATSALGDTCGALLAPALGLLGEVVNERTNGLAAHMWRVREVAMVGALRALDALRDDAAGIHDDAALHDDAAAAAAAGGSARADEPADIRAVRKELQAAVVVRLSLERRPSVQALQRNGEALAAELNAPLRVASNVLGGNGREQLPSKMEGVENKLDELRKTIEGERESRAKQEREEERERLAAIERHEAWAQAQHVVRQTIDAQLLELEEAQKAVAREPDLLRKQLLLVRCRDVHAALAQSSRNVRDIGTGIGVVVGFLTTVNAKLDAVNESLNALQSSVRELGADLRRMVGRPALEELAEQRGKRLAQCQELRREVYIATDGVGPGDDGKFLVSESNEPKDLLKAVKTELLESKSASLLLLSGPAGSGKSTFVRHLEVYLETEYVEQTRGERGEVVLVKVSLPTLKNPTADLFREALQQKGLREAQIHELRDLARAGTVQLIFLLDAYDELPSQCLFKNLYMSNSLEQYRDLSEEGAAPLAYPKVIITTRTELLSRAAEYHHAFVPMETGEPARATMEAARAAFLELRIAPFGSKVDAYIHAKVALEVRRELDRQVGALAPLSKEAAEALRAGAGALWRHDALKEGSGGELLDAACAAVTAPGGRSESLERVTRYMQQVPHDLLALQLLPSWPVVWALAGALAETPLGLEQALKSFCEGLARAETGKIWLHRDYRDAFDAIPELKELTTTPFMVEIVMEILPKLQELQSTDASMKAKLLLLLEQDAAQMVWGCISRWRGPGNSVLLQLQAALKGGSDVAPAQGLESLKKLEDEVVGMLKGQGLVLNQPKLVALGWEQLQATGVAFGQRPRRGGSDGNTAACDVSMDDQAGPEAQVDWILDEVVEDVIQEEEEEEEKDRLLEDIICQVGILYVLKNALCRQKVQGSHIYAMFMYMFVQREARKAVTQGAYDADTVEREGAQYAQRLALTMVAENVTKVPLRSDSELFHEESIWDPFLRDGGELRATVQKAAPELMAGHGDAPQPVGAATQGGVKGSKEVDLRHEDVVRDFLVDLFLEDVEFISEAAFVVAWAERCCKGGYLAGAGGHACDLLLNNVRALLGGALPKRSGGTLLHAAASDGAYFAVSKILEMLSTGLADGALLEQRDDEGRTPLFCAAQSGHAQVAAALLAAGAQRDARSKLRPEILRIGGSRADCVCGLDRQDRPPVCAHDGAGSIKNITAAILYADKRRFRWNEQLDTDDVGTGNCR